jgi:ribosomal protein S6--L-glutamate ligase
VIIRNNRELQSRYAQLGLGDVVIGQVAGRYLKPAVLIDLLQRGVDCIPAPLSQMLNASKAAQARVLQQWMLPHTVILQRRKDLYDAIGHYHKLGIGAVVTKEDTMHCGQGIRRWETMDHLYNVVAMSGSAYPLVLQPYHEGLSDVRVIIVGTYVEAYQRQNRYDFRANLASGGHSRPHRLSAEQESFCRAVIQRGHFPYAHVDLQLLTDGTHYLGEIALNGGIRGARINRSELNRLKTEVLEELAQQVGKR